MTRPNIQIDDEVREMTEEEYDMTIANPPKALILLVALLSLVLLMAIGKVDTDSGMPILTAIVFYGIGNGVAAKQGNPSQPIIGSKNDQ
jgi:hypothetical protein